MSSNTPDRKMVASLIKDSFDMHLHANPHTKGLKNNNIIEMARQAKNLGMRGIVFKDASFPSGSSAYLVNKIVDGITVFGGIVLNSYVGGMNPSAVNEAISYGEGIKGEYTKIVWMPTFDARASVEYKQRPLSESVEVVKNGKPLPEVGEILDLIAENNLVLATSHLLKDEIMPLMDEARSRGVRKIVVTHPEAHIPNLSIEDQKEMVKMSAYIEHCFVVCTPYYRYKLHHDVAPMEIAQAIKETGADHCVMATDFGGDPGTNISPAEGMWMYVSTMLACGISPQEIETMIKKNPASLLGLEMASLI